MCAEVVKLVDAVDSKSTGPCAHAGSIPAFGTIHIKEQLGKIAITQYSMIVEGDELSVCIFFGLARRARKHLQNQGCLKYPETSTTIIQNPWRYKCLSDILLLACA
jgi:hypothetical protein